MSLMKKIHAHYSVSSASKIEMFATENDTDLWAVAVDGFFGLFKTKTEADKVYSLIGGTDDDSGDQLAETAFGAAQQIPPRYKPKNAKCKISDFTPINIKDYITKHASRDMKNWKLKTKVIAGLNKQSLLTAFKESIDSGDIKDALEEFHHEYMSHQQYDDDEDEHLGDDEMYERTLDYLDKRWQKFKTNFKADFLDGRLVVWREVKLKTSKDKINTDKVGVYWSWDKEKAQSWWGKHEHSVMLKATVDLSSIDIHMTLASNLYKEHILENEIRLKSGAKVQLLEPIQKAVTATIVIRVKNSSKIK